jgi:hypothetical protein
MHEIGLGRAHCTVLEIRQELGAGVWNQADGMANPIANTRSATY